MFLKSEKVHELDRFTFVKSTWTLENIIADVSWLSISDLHGKAFDLLSSCALKESSAVKYNSRQLSELSDWLFMIELFDYSIWLPDIVVSNDQFSILQVSCIIDEFLTTH